MELLAHAEHSGSCCWWSDSKCLMQKGEQMGGMAFILAEGPAVSSQCQPHSGKTSWQCRWAYNRGSHRGGHRDVRWHLTSWTRRPSVQCPYDSAFVPEKERIFFKLIQSWPAISTRCSVKHGFSLPKPTVKRSDGPASTLSRVLYSNLISNFSNTQNLLRLCPKFGLHSLWGNARLLSRLNRALCRTHSELPQAFHVSVKEYRSSSDVHWTSPWRYGLKEQGMLILHQVCN